MIPFNKPYLTGNELNNIQKAYSFGQLAGDGVFSKKCQSVINSLFNTPYSLLTHSCTAALEMAAILCDIKEGDEVIMPSYTFVSTANAFVLRGGIPVFVDINPETLNIDESLIPHAVSEKTKAIVPVHYGGVGCNMTEIAGICERKNLFLVEDAAQGICARYESQPLGSFGDLSTVSFHETKNVICGEGGALLINNKDMLERAEIIREKGTNRSQFFKGQVDKYSWVDIGSSFLPGEVNAAFLLAQLEEAYEITNKRIQIWNKYHSSFKELEISGKVTRPKVPRNASHNAHMYYLTLNSEESRDSFIDYMKTKVYHVCFHYQPLPQQLIW